MNNQLQNFINKIEKIFDFLGISENKEEIKINLMASLYLELINSIGADQKNKDLLIELSKKNPKNQQEYDESFGYAIKKSKELGYDVVSELSNTSQNVLNNYIKEFELKLPPEKIAELKKIILG